MIILFLSLILFSSILQISFATPFNPSNPQFKEDASTSFLDNQQQHLIKPFQPSKNNNNVGSFFVGNYFNSQPKNLKIATKKVDGSINTSQSQNSATVIKNSSKNNEGQETKPSLGVIGFQPQQQTFNEPKPVDFGFFPVFPWPKNLKVGHLFPQRANNEMWPPPRSDPRLSRFPAAPVPKLPNTLNVGFAMQPLKPVRRVHDGEIFPKPPPSTTTRRPIIRTSTTRKPPTTTTFRPETTTFDDSHNHVWNFAPVTSSPLEFDFHGFGHEITSTSPPPPPSTTKTTTTRKSIGSPPGVAPPDWIGRNPENGLLEEPSFNSNKKFIARDMPNRRRIFSSKSQNEIKKISIFKKEFNKKQKKFRQCRQLSPSTDSILHPKTDKSCDQSLPGFHNDDRCRCRFIVATRDFAGCATKFYSLCFRI